MEAKRISNFLFELTCDDYEQYRPVMDAYLRTAISNVGCSCVQNGYIRGRNNDWYLEDPPVCVVHVPANDKGRHGSVGVSAANMLTPEILSTAGMPDELGHIFPYLTADGINDEGLCININVVNYGELGKPVPRDPEKMVSPTLVPRLVLDSCGTIEEAVALIGSLDLGTVGTFCEAHYMISGKQSAADDTFNTVVVELIPDENMHYGLNVIDYNKGEFVDNKPVMTNFHLTGFDGTLASATKRPMGYERWQLLHRHFAQGNSPRGMLDLMRKVYYTNAYDLTSDNFWYSDLCFNDLTKDDFGPANLQGDAKNGGKFAERIEHVMEMYAENKPNKALWQTVYTTVYDCKNKQLYVTPLEARMSFRFGLEAE
ncbi:MAG: hypothetical protein Q4C54_05025 [Clostridia bacterium]|nr:hypothetical protein [Clostridia bacterium]